MNYTFKCPKCKSVGVFTAPISQGPPSIVTCWVKNRRGKKCLTFMRRDWQADAPMLDTSKCKDHNFIPHEKRVASHWDRGGEDRMEQAFQQKITRRRQEIRDAGGQRGSLKQTHAVPSHLFHGKIKETGDDKYWSDPKNLAKHKECKVD